MIVYEANLKIAGCNLYWQSSVPNTTAIETNECRVTQKKLSCQGDFHLRVVHAETDSAVQITHGSG